MADERALMTRQQAEQLVRKHFPGQVTACEEMLDLAWQLLGATSWRGRPADDGMVDKLMASVAARGLKTYRSAIDAALGGYGPQAAMMNRALFEGMAMAHWVRANPEVAVQRFDEHLHHNRGLWNKRLISRGWLDQPLDEVPDHEEQARLDKTFGRWGDKLWCGLSLRQLVEAIQDEWQEDDDRTELWDFFVIVQAYNNETLHTTALSLASPVLEDSSTQIRIDTGPSLDQAEQALLGSLWSYTHLFDVTTAHFDIEGRERIADLFTRSRAAFARIDPHVQRQTGRNAPCPCGSGQKFKRCHGR